MKEQEKRKEENRKKRRDEKRREEERRKKKRLFHTGRKIFFFPFQSEHFVVYFLYTHSVTAFLPLRYANVMQPLIKYKIDDLKKYIYVV